MAKLLPDHNRHTLADFINLAHNIRNDDLAFIAVNPQNKLDIHYSRAMMKQAGLDGEDGSPMPDVQNGVHASDTKNDTPMSDAVRGGSAMEKIVKKIKKNIKFNILNCQCCENGAAEVSHHPLLSLYTRHYQKMFSPGTQAIFRLLTQTRYYCSCIKTKLLLATILMDNFGVSDAIHRFNRVFHRCSMHSPLTSNQVMELLK